MFGEQSNRARTYLLVQGAVGHVMVQMSDGDTPSHAGEGGIASAAPATEAQGGTVQECVHGLSHLFFG